MQQGNQSASASRPSAAQATAFALRSLGQVYDINVATTRVLWQAQARAASAFGWPDWSSVFDQVDDRARDVFVTGAEQLVQATQRANDAAIEFQQHVGRVVQTQAATVADSLQQSMQEIGEQTGEGLRQLCDSARLHAEQAERVTQSAGQEFRDTLREGSQQARNVIRESGRQLDDAVRQSGEQAGEMLRQGGQQAREEVQRGGEAVQREVQRGSEAVQRAGEAASSATGSGNGQDGQAEAQPATSDERSGRRPKNPPQASA